jgi:pimeloyl-ACP methyl ester carboxylesterase
MALTDSLKIAKADIVGWGDGGILGIDPATRHKDGVGKVFAFATNTSVKDSVEQNPTFAAFTFENTARIGRNLTIHIRNTGPNLGLD